MKTLILLLITINCCAQSKIFSKTNLVSYGLCFVAGLSDGINDAIVAHDPWPESSFWSLYSKNSYENKEKYGWLRREVLTFTTDGYHLTKFVTYASFSVAV